MNNQELKLENVSEKEPEMPLIGMQTTLEVKKVASLIKTDTIEKNEVELE